MNPESIKDLFPDSVLKNLFPPERADLFFDALYGDMNEGAYDIDLSFDGLQDDTLKFQFNLRRRPQKCLACNLTYGLPHVFSRHPVIDAKGLVKEIEKALNGTATCGKWELGETLEITADLHMIPLTIKIQPSVKAS